MRLYSYVVEHDWGFAPNPFHGVCTLATCKSRIRSSAKLGDYVIGTGCARRKRQGHLVYFMRVDEILTYDLYWRDARFEAKRPRFDSSLKYAYGDNIYHTDAEGNGWVQHDSFHSRPGGVPHEENLRQDTWSSNVLVGKEFAYWGETGPEIPATFRDPDGIDVVIGGVGHKSESLNPVAENFVAWLKSLNAQGVVGYPVEWSRGRRAT